MSLSFDVDINSLIIIRAHDDQLLGNSVTLRQKKNKCILIFLCAQKWKRLKLERSINPISSYALIECRKSVVYGTRRGVVFLFLSEYRVVVNISHESGGGKMCSKCIAATVL